MCGVCVCVCGGGWCAAIINAQQHGACVGQYLNVVR